MITINSSEPSRLESSVSQASASSAVVECDWCGRHVRRDAAFERVQRADDEVEVVFLCATCEFGGD